MTTITALPTPPSRADSTNFSTRGDAFLGALPTFVTEANAVGSEATAAAAAAAASASAAAASQSTASTAAAAVAAQSPVANAASAAASAAAAAASAAAAAQTSGAVAATTLSASGAVSGAGFSAYLASPPAIGGTAPAAASFTSLNTGQLAGLRNRIINGAMTIDQRNAGASVTADGTALYTLDRWGIAYSLNNKYTIQQTPSTTETGFAVRLGAGFTNYLATTVAVAANVTVGAGDYFLVLQKIEGLNIPDLAWGTSSAKAVTLSFWAYSSLTGTFGGSLKNSAGTRSYPFTYIISAANTWEKKTITITGDTTGTWLTTSGIGINISFSLGTGSTFTTTSGAWAAGNYFSATGATNVISTNSATFYITGVQLELGSVATPFEQRLYGMELALCQRYLPVFESNSAIAGFMYSTTTGLFGIPFPVTARVAPTGLTTTAGGSLYDAAGGGRPVTSVTFVAGGVSSGFIQAVASSAGLTAAQGTIYYGNRVLFTGCEL